MFKISPCSPTIGKIKLILDDVFKLSRVTGTFPIDTEYSGISKYNLAKGFVLYILAAAITAFSVLTVSRDDVLLLQLNLNIFQILPLAFFHLTHLVWLVRNRRLVKEMYEELKDIEYQMWKSGIDWYYKPSWCVKYLSFTVMMACQIVWEIFYNRWIHPELRIAQHILYPSLFSITSQYLALLQICLSVLKKIRTTEEDTTVVKLTDKLLALCENVNALYEPQLLCYIANMFIVIIAVIYVKIIQRAPIYIGTVCWAMNFVCPLLVITLYVGYISQQVDKINKMLYRRLLHNLDDELLYFHLLAKRDLVFTANGFFNIDTTLIFSMIATGLDYLIFLVQYM